MINYTLKLASAAALSICLVGSAQAQSFDIGAMNDTERQAFRDEIRAYLLENPEVLVEAINVLEQRQKEQETVTDKQLITANGAALFLDSNSFVGGNPDGDVVMVEFTDYRCGFCKKAHPEVSELLSSDGNIRYIIKEFPILGEQSVLGARFAIATMRIAGNDAYAMVNENLMSFRGEISITSLTRLSDSLGLDTTSIIAEMEADEVTAIINENRALAQRMKINGTPGFVVGDQMMRGYVPLEGMREVVAQIRQASQ